ncbi:hypothetical protein CsSME_00028920 [Camellia sinensis var. sinensis]
MTIDKTHEAVPGKPTATSSSPRASTAISPSLDPRKQSPPADLYVNDSLHQIRVCSPISFTTLCRDDWRHYLLRRRWLFDRFSESNGFRFDFLRHVVPGRLETLSPQKKVVIRSANSVVIVNGVVIHSSEVVLAVSHTIDELKHSSAKGPISKGRER